MEEARMWNEGVPSDYRELSRRDFLRAGVGAGALAALGGMSIGSGEAAAYSPSNRHGGYGDAVTNHALSQLNGYIRWLGGRRGYVGEVGIPSNDNFREQFYPDQRRWKTLGNVWYNRADRAGLWVTAQECSERQIWGGYFASLYGSRGVRNSKGEYDRAISRRLYQGSVVEAHPSVRGKYRRGLNIPDGQTIKSKSNFSNRHREVFNSDYWYPGLARDSVTGRNSFEYLYARGIRLVRLGFRWERLQPVPGKGLNTTELRRYEASLTSARAAGLKVVVDLHNYGGYYFDDGRQPLNSPRLTAGHFRNIWRQLSYHFQRRPEVIAYDLMNEPFNDGGIRRGSYSSEARAWEALTRGAVHDIRRRGDKKLIMVPVYSGIEKVSSNHTRGPWIPNVGNLTYTAHQYFDHYYGSSTGGGHYKQSYGSENSYFVSKGY